MAKTVADIAIGVGMDISALLSGSAKAEAAMGRFDRALNSVGNGLQSVGGKMTAAGKTMSIATAAIAGVTGAAIAMTKATADQLEAIQNSAKAAGVSAEFYQEMAYAVGEVADISEEDLGAAMVKLNKTLGDAQGGAKGATEALKKLGFTQDQISAGSIGNEAAFGAMIAKLEEMENPTEAAALAADLLGKSGARLGGLMAGTAGQVDELRQKARDLGVIFSEDTTQAADDFNRKWDDVALQIGAVKVAIADSLMPVMTNELLPLISDKVIPAIVWLVNKIGDMGNAFSALPEPAKAAIEIVAGLFAVGGPLMIGIGLVSTALGALVAGPAAPFVLMAMAAGAIITAWATWGDDIKAAIGPAVTWISDTVTPLFDALGPFGQLIAAPVKIVAAFISFGSDIKGALAAGMDWVIGKFDALLAKITMLTEKLTAWKGAVDEFFATDTSNLPTYGPSDAESVTGGAGVLGGGTGGGAMADGLANGFVDGLAGRQEDINGAVDGMTQGVRDRLGIKSPSTVFAEIGGYIAEGLAQGITSAQGLVSSAMQTVGQTSVASMKGYATDALGVLGDLFQGSKAIAAAQALVNAWAGASEALKLPFPSNLIAFGKVLATGLGAVQAIKGASIGGGGGGGRSGGGSTSTAAAAPQTQSVANITLVGDTFSRDSIADLFKQINEGLKSGRTINLVNA